MVIVGENVKKNPFTLLRKDVNTALGEWCEVPSKIIISL